MDIFFLICQEMVLRFTKNTVSAGPLGTFLNLWATVFNYHALFSMRLIEKPIDILLLVPYTIALLVPTLSTCRGLGLIITAFKNTI